MQISCYVSIPPWSLATAGSIKLTQCSFVCSNKCFKVGPVSIVCLLMFYVLATSKVISGSVPTCDSAYSWWIYSVTSLGYQAASTMICYLTQSHYPGTEPRSPCNPNNAERQARKWQVLILMSLVWLDQTLDSNLSWTYMVKSNYLFQLWKFVAFIELCACVYNQV